MTCHFDDYDSGDWDRFNNAGPQQYRAEWCDCEECAGDARPDPVFKRVGLTLDVDHATGVVILRGVHV